ncbi:MAG: hypothetical protein IJ491_09860 [Clostridia bacterium]|nr:hypothetical protein [Clostridia bacterium]
MSRSYKLRLSDKYNISPNRYAELKAFCLQYEEKRAELEQLYSLSSVPPEVAVMGGEPGKPTERKAMRASKLKREIELIDRSLEAVCGADIGIIEVLKKNVTLGYGYDKLGYVPCGINQFYKHRRKFFFLLDKEKE